MTAKRRILAISGSYRDDGITDQAVAGVLENLQSLDADTTGPAAFYKYRRHRSLRLTAAINGNINNQNVPPPPPG